MHHHKLAGHKLSRERDQRRALLKGLANSLVLNESITTTKPKAKSVQPYIERLITKCKQGGLHQRRQVLTQLNRGATEKLFADLAQRFAKRNGGYTRLQAAGWRRGDNAQLATISFTEKPSSIKPESIKMRKPLTKTTQVVEAKRKPEEKPNAKG